MTQRINYDRLLTFKASANIPAGVMVKITDWDTEDSELGPIAVVSVGGGDDNDLVGVTVNTAKAGKKINVAGCPGEVVNARVDQDVVKYEELKAGADGEFDSHGSGNIHAIAMGASTGTVERLTPILLLRTRTRNITPSPNNGAAQTTTGSAGGAITAVTITAFTGGIGDLTYSVAGSDSTFNGLVINNARSVTGNVNGGVAAGTYNIVITATDTVGQIGTVDLLVTVS